MRAICLLLVVVVGCGKAKPPSPVNPFPPEMVKWAEQGAANAAKHKADNEKMQTDLKANPQPVLDTAMESVRNSFTKTIGDDAMKSAKIEVDPKSLKTFGGEKWTVRGSFAGHDQNDKPLATVWESTVLLSGTKLSVISNNLNVRP